MLSAEDANIVVSDVTNRNGVNGVYKYAGKQDSVAFFVNFSTDGAATHNKGLWRIEKSRSDAPSKGTWAICSPMGVRMFYSRESGDLPSPGQWSDNYARNSHANILLQSGGCSDVAKTRGRDNVLSIQERVWKRRKYTDAVVICQGVRFDVHRSTLSAPSHVFEAAFENPMK